MDILITGATGLVGTYLVRLLQSRGHRIAFLTTDPAKTGSIPGAQGFLWNPAKGTIDVAALKSAEVIVHLAGASIGKRWTREYKNEIIKSRVASAALIFQSLSLAPHKVRHFVSASGIGIYPNSITKRYSEDFKGPAHGFTAEVVRQWEQAADAFALINVGVAKVRTGLVLSQSGGALEPMARPVKLGLGAAMGSGKQVISWVHVEDLASLYAFVIEHRLEGTYNAVSPEPVSNSVLTREIAGALNKPLWLPNVPAALLKMALGEMSSLLLEGQFVESEKITSHGFEFKYPAIRPALDNLLA